MMDLARLSGAIELKQVDRGQRIITGWAAWHGNLDLVRDIIVGPSAFRKTLAEKPPSAVAVFIAHHQDALPVGIPQVIQAESKGLYTETYVLKGTSGDDLLDRAADLLAHGQTLGLSIGYRTRDSKHARGPDGKLVRYLTDLDLIEYSFAASQSIANPQALVTGVKAMTYRIEQRGDTYVLLDADGEEEGRFPSQAAAEAERRRLMRDGDEPDNPGPKGKTAGDGPEHKAVWDTAYVNNLPDSAFLRVDAGTKDDEGKTVPRSNRHLPYKNADGQIDAPHLRNAIARIPQLSGVDEAAKGALQARARRLLDQLDSGKLADDDTPEWKQGAPLSVRALGYALLDASDQIAAEHKAMALLGDDTKAGQRVRGEMRAKLRELAKAINDIAEWADYVDTERDKGAKLAHYRRELDLLALAG